MGRVDLRKDAEHRENECCQNGKQRDNCPSSLDDIGNTHIERNFCTAEVVAVTNQRTFSVVVAECKEVEGF